MLYRWDAETEDLVNVPARAGGNVWRYAESSNSSVSSESLSASLACVYFPPKKLVPEYTLRIQLMNHEKNII